MHSKKTVMAAMALAASLSRAAETKQAAHEPMVKRKKRVPGAPRSESLARILRKGKV